MDRAVPLLDAKIYAPFGAKVIIAPESVRGRSTFVSALEAILEGRVSSLTLRPHLTKLPESFARVKFSPRHLRRFYLNGLINRI